MKVIYHNDFNQSYCSDPAAAPGRIEAVHKAIRNRVTFIDATPADKEDIAAIHTPYHIERVTSDAIYYIASLAAGGAIQAAEIGLKEPCFAVIRPPGHHASAGSAWGFCYFNNMAIALDKLKREKKITKAFVLDIDLHFGDGTVNILEGSGYVSIYNPSASHPEEYLKNVKSRLSSEKVDIIGVSAGFDNHAEDWGGGFFLPRIIKKLEKWSGKPAGTMGEGVLPSWRVDIITGFWDKMYWPLLKGWR